MGVRMGIWHRTTTAGITFGSCLAIVVSYSAWHSIPWAILHGILSWGYVIYYAIRYLGLFG
jgi:hypothetical protein